MQIQKLGKISFESLDAGDRIKFLYNSKSLMIEMWGRFNAETNDWFLVDAFPNILTFFEGFRSGLLFGTDLNGKLALALENAWNINGNRGGADPTVANFGLDSSELIIRTTAVATDWIAIHTGGNYTWMVHSDRPRSTFVIREISDPTVIRFLIGLVGSVGLEAGSGAVAWATPDDGIWVEYDSDVDTHVRFVTRSNGVSTTTDIGVLDHGSWEASFNINDEGNKVDCLRLSLLASHTTNIPACIMKPIFMVGNRGAFVRSMNPSFALLTAVGET